MLFPVANAEGWPEFHEANDCHAPGGSPAGGQFCSKGSGGSVAPEGYFFYESGPLPMSGPEPIFFHGSPSGDLRGGGEGLHIGSKKAATEALEARIGVPASGSWDGTRKYGETKLAGTDTLARKGIYPTGLNAGGPGKPTPKKDYYPTKGLARYGDGSPVPLSATPSVVPVKLVGRMANNVWHPHQDFAAGGRMRGHLKRGAAKSGYFYTNVSEDEGSISAVVPSGVWVQPLKKRGARD